MGEVPLYCEARRVSMCRGRGGGGEGRVLDGPASEDKGCYALTPNAVEQRAARPQRGGGRG